MNFIEKLIYLPAVLRKYFSGSNKIPDGVSFIGLVEPNLTIGIGTYCNGMTIYCWDDRISISIGNYCSIADKINIIAGGEHDKYWVSTYPFLDRWNLETLLYKKVARYKGNISIGHDVWIANNVTILSGVNIASGAILGANSVVTKNVPPYAIVAGNPANIIRYRFDLQTIEALLQIQWWLWDEQKIREELLPYIDDIQTFLKNRS